MLEKIKKTLNDIKSAIMERGGTFDPCDSPSTYASKILAINNNGVAMAFIPVFKVSDSKPARPTTRMSALNPTNYPDGWGEPDNLSGNIWMSYTLVGNSYVYIPWTDPILINGEYTAPVSRTFTIFGQLSSLNLDPSVPVGGMWDVANNRLVGDITSSLSNGNTLTWSTENKRISGQYTYVSNGTFSSETGEIIGNWSEPYCINEVRSGADGVGIRETIAYYRGSINATGEEAPDKNVNPKDRGWTTDVTEIELSTNTPYLWKFTRIIYTDDSVWQESPYVVRMYVDVGYQEIVDTVVPQLIEQLSGLQVRLNEVEETDALIKTDPENGLIKLLTSYKEQVDSHTQTSFADAIANAADATIKQSVGSALGANITGVESTLDGINGYLQNLVTNIYGADGSVGSALQQIKADSITQSVSNGQYYWQRRIHNPESEITDPTVDGYWKDDTETRSSLGDYANPLLPCTVIDIDPITYNTPNPETGIVDGLSYKWFREVTITAMSAIKQTADDIFLVVGDGTPHRAAIDIIAADYDTGTSKIVLDAANIQLNGNVLATALNANQITVTGENSGIIVQNDATNPTTITSILPSGLRANNATIDGNLYSSNGFFGNYTLNGDIFTPINGVYLGPNGLYSSNFDRETESGFALFGDSYALYGADGSKITQQGVVAKTITSSNEKYKTSIDEKGFQITSIDGEPLAQFVVYDETNNYVKLRLYGPDGYVELSNKGVQTFGPSDIEQKDNAWFKLNSVMAAPRTVIDPSGIGEIGSNQPINQEGALWRGVYFDGTVYSRYSNGWKRAQSTTWYYNPEDTSTDSGYNLSEQYKYHDRYFKTTIPLQPYLVPEGDYISEPQYVGRPAFIIDSEYNNYEFFSCNFYTFGNEGKLEVSQSLFFCQWGAGYNPTSKEYVPGALYKVVVVRR